MAVSFILIQHYNALFERACDAVHAYSNAVNLVYGRRGFLHRNYQVRVLFLSATCLFTNSPFQGEIVQDAFCRGLGHAIQWYDNLQVRIEQEIEAATVAGDRCSSETIPTLTPTMPTGDAPIPEQLTADDSPPAPPVPLIECARVLQQRCPACFGLRTFGRSGAT